MSKIHSNAVNTAAESYLLAVLERGTAGRLKLQDAQAVLAMLEACKAFSEINDHASQLAIGRELIEKAEQVRLEGNEISASAIAELKGFRAELAALRKPTKHPEKPNRRRQRASSK